ncbi:hypothetical protein RQN9TF_18180 [Rhodococcus qingshengii]|uniref:hypothetical protein n=1 Tax=Rhodococcus TaxID=1827 RepID=UPI000F626ACF|nr:MULTISPECIES: hypothetical protein [Rhodococcus]AZI62800.1 hypothetical protein EHW12_17720 [Rhodococcus sp. NJ-530]BDQ21145.1 hypothetical protein RQN9TF_18180 [Rhodococcus qingshengii]
MTTTLVEDPQYPPIDYFRGWPPIEVRTDAEWHYLACLTIAESGILDGDVDAMALALKSSAAREQAYRDEIVAGWAAIETEAHAMNDAIDAEEVNT